MKNLLSTIAIIACAALGAVAVTPQNAQASQSSAASQSDLGSGGGTFAPEFGDVDVLEFMATGRGPMAEAFPDLATLVPRTSVRLESQERHDLLEAYLKAEPRFNELVTRPLQSGDPYETLDGLNALQKVTSIIAKDRQASPDVVGDGKCATLVAVALWLAVALAVVLWVPARVADQTGAPLTTERFAADLSMATRDRAGVIN